MLISSLSGADNEVWDNKPLGKPVKPVKFAAPTIKQPLKSNRLERPASGQAVKLIADRQPWAVIFYASTDPEGQAAAQLLQQELKEASGVKLPLLTERTPSASIKLVKNGWQINLAGKTYPYIVFMGTNTYAQQAGIAATALPPEGLWLKTQQNALFIVGNHAGPTYGVIELLERWGFRKLWPGKLGSVYPKRKSYVVKPMDFRDHPALHQRGMRCPVKYDPQRDRPAPRRLTGLRRLHFPVELVNYQDPERIQWAAWNRLEGIQYLDARHSYRKYWGRYGKSHPEFFALQKDGSRLPLPRRKPYRSQLCFSNPDLIDIIARERIAQLKSGRSHVSLSPEDGGGGNCPCMCVRCRLLDPANAAPIVLPSRDPYVALSDRYVKCFNKITEKIVAAVPDAQVTMIAYSQFRSAPLGVKAHPNLIVGYVGYAYDDAGYLADCRKEWDRWTTRVNRLFWRPNLFYGQRAILSCYATDLGKDIPHLYETGMIGTDIDTFGHSWATNGLNYYVVPHLLWNPAQKVEPLIADYCRAGFGAAAPQIRKYIALVEKMTRHNAALGGDFRKKPMADADNDLPGHKLPGALFASGYSEADLQQLYGVLAEADAVNQAHGNDPVIRQRIDFLRSGIKFTEVRKKAFTVCYHQPGTLQEMRQALDEQYEYFKILLIKYPHAIDVGMVSFYDHNFWRRKKWSAKPEKRLNNPQVLQKFQAQYPEFFANLPSRK